MPRRIVSSKDQGTTNLRTTSAAQLAALDGVHLLSASAKVYPWGDIAWWCFIVSLAKLVKISHISLHGL